MKKEILVKYINENLSINDISKKIGKSKTTIRYWLNKYKLKTKLKSSFIECNLNISTL